MFMYTWGLKAITFYQFCQFICIFTAKSSKIKPLHRGWKAITYHHFPSHFSRQVLEPAFYHFFIDFQSFGVSIWRPLALLLGSLFRVTKNQISFLGSAPGPGLSAIPPGEGGNWGTSGRHLGGKVPKEAQRWIWRTMCQNHYVFLSKVAQPSVSSRRERRDMHQVV